MRRFHSELPNSVVGVLQSCLAELSDVPVVMLGRLHLRRCQHPYT
jgi:hypothetical protein